MGYAVLEAKDLLYFGVHTFRHRTSPRRLLAEGPRFVGDLITKFDPHLFVIEKISHATPQRSARLRVFVEEIQRCAQQHRVQVATYTLTTVKHTITGNRDASTREVAESLVQSYSYLAKYLQTDLRTREHYWHHMFAAVALGLTGTEDASKKALYTKRSPTESAWRSNNGTSRRSQRPRRP